MRSMVKKPSTQETIKLTLTALASGAIWFYTGPVASVAAREAFKLGYDLLYGVPHWYNPSYALSYMPLREHVAHYAFEYGGLMLGSVCAPIIYKGINAATNMGGKVLTSLGLTSAEENNSDEEMPVPALQFSSRYQKSAPNHLPEQAKEALDAPYNRTAKSAPNLRLY
jgi:hypothetical protein